VIKGRADGAAFYILCWRRRSIVYRSSMVFLNLRKSMSASVIDRDVTRRTMACSLNRILTIKRSGRRAVIDSYQASPDAVGALDPPTIFACSI